MLLDFTSFHRAKNSEGRKDYFSTRLTKDKKVRTCCECLFIIPSGDEHHHAVGFWRCDYSDWRTCMNCHKLLIELEHTSVQLSSITDFRFGRLHKRIDMLRSQFPNEFSILENRFRLTEILKRVEKKKGWRDAPMQAHFRIRTNSKLVSCCQCYRSIKPKTQYEEATVTVNHEIKAFSKTCLECTEKRKVLEPYFAAVYSESQDQVLRTYCRRSIYEALRDLSNPRTPITIVDPLIAKMVEDFIAANKRFKSEAEEEFKEEVKRRESGFVPPTTPYEFRLKEALEFIGYKVIHNEPLGYYFPDLLIGECKCICEVDGGYHLTDRQQAKDSYRTEYLNSQGYFVVRVSNERVSDDLANVIEEIESAIISKENVNLG